MINTVKNIIFMTFLLGAGFIVLAVGWGGAPFDTAGSAMRGGAFAIGDAAEIAHEFVSSAPDKASDAMRRTGNALWRPMEKLGGLLGISDDKNQASPTAQTEPPLTAKASPAKAND